MTSEFGIRFHQGGGARNNCLTLDFFHKFSSHRCFLEFTATFFNLSETIVFQIGPISLIDLLSISFDHFPNYPFFPNCSSRSGVLRSKLCKFAFSTPDSNCQVRISIEISIEKGLVKLLL